MNYKANQKVKLVIGKLAFNRTIAYINKGAVYLVEGGDSFDATTGKVYGGGKVNKQIIAA